MDHISAMYKRLDDKFGADSLFNEVLQVIAILVFDLIKRSFREISLFDHFTMEKYEACSLRVMGECLSVCCSVQDGATDEIWVMKEYKM